MIDDPRIRRDARRLAGDPEAAALFECLLKHRFDPALDSAFLARKCDAPRAVRNRLTAKIGPLFKYLAGLRMAEAGRLVIETELTIGEIGKRVGYPRQRTFRRNFQNAHGKSPQQMRRQARMSGAGATGDAAAAGDAGVTPAAAEAPDPEPELETPDTVPARRARAARLCRQRQLGMLDPQRAGELRLELRRRHPRLDAEQAAAPGDTPPGGTPPEDGVDRLPVVLTPTGDRLEQTAAEAAFATILDLGPDDQRFALLQVLQLGNVTAFEHLPRFCLGRVHSGAERSLAIARLGVELVESHRGQMHEEADQWQALAWVGLARVQVYAGDFGDAEQSLAFAAAEVDGEDGLEPWVEIELREVEGMIKRMQRREAEAARAFDRALELGRRLDRRDPSRSLSVLRRLELASATADAEAGFALIEELEALVTGDGEPDPWANLWQGLIAFHRAKAYAALGIEDGAEGLLRRALADLQTEPAYSADSQLAGLCIFVLHDLARLVVRDGRFSEGEGLLRVTLERYRECELPVLAAGVEAELAAVCALRGRRTEARQLAASAADFLERLPPLHREALSTARRLRAMANSGAAASEEELRELLDELQRDLDRVAWEIPDARVASALQARESAHRAGAEAERGP